MGREPLICRCNLNRQTFIIDARPGPARQEQATQFTQCRKVFMWVAPNCLTHQQTMECLLPPFPFTQHSIGSSAARPVCLVVLLSCYFGACIVRVLLSLLSISMAAFGVILGVGMMINECSWCCCCCCWWYSCRCYATASTVDLKLAVVLNHDGKLQQHFLPVRRASKNWLAWKLASLARNTTCLACRSMSWLSSVLYEAVSAQFPLYVQRTKFGLLRKSSLPLAVLCMRMWGWERRRSSTPVSILSIGIVMGFHCSALAIRLTSLPGKWQQQLAAATFSSSLWPTYVCHATLWLPFRCGPVCKRFGSHFNCFVLLLQWSCCSHNLQCSWKIC